MNEQKLILENKDKNNFLYRNQISTQNQIYAQNPINFYLHKLHEQNKTNAQVDTVTTNANTNTTTTANTTTTLTATATATATATTTLTANTNASPKKSENLISKIKSLSFDHLEECMYPKMNFKQSASNISIGEDYDVI